MRELAQRELADGSRTIITLYLADDGRLIVEAANDNGVSTGEAPAHEALLWYHHPFASEDRLDYPSRAHQLAQRSWTPEEYALLEALNEQEV